MLAVKVTVEAELGYVPTVDNGKTISEDQLTKSEEVKLFVNKTRYDTLLVVVGTIKGNYIGVK